MLDLLRVHAFLEHSFCKSVERELYAPRDDVINIGPTAPSYELPLLRDVIDGNVEPELSNQVYMKNTLDVSSYKNGSIKDSNVIKSVAVLSDECFRQKHKVSFLRGHSLDIPGICGSELEHPTTLWQDIAKWVDAAVINKWCDPECTSQHKALPAFDFSYMREETQKLLAKRSKSIKADKKYAIMENTLQTLPSLQKLIKDPAHTWDFELDTFQKQAILCLERNQSVFVAAHTSAGKTVVAEYACAMCRRRGSRVIYTSPIKALSNQKFHDFKQTFGQDVGLLTGDIKVATDSSFLVMTTEILYNMLCNAADAIRDLEVVILDEVHYLIDPERGHVWEQIMIMLPKHVLLVMLSATVPNTLDFADWLGRIRGSEIHVVTTDKRPVPLEHYLFSGLDGQDTKSHLHLIVDQNGRFNLPGYKQASQILAARISKQIAPTKQSGKKEKEDEGKKQIESKQNKPDNHGNSSSGKSQKRQMGHKFNTPGRFNYMQPSGGMTVNDKRTKNLWLGLVRLLQERDLMPTIAFGFSRTTLETLAHYLSSIDLLTSSEKNEVQVFLRHSIKNQLKGPDSQLPSVLLISDLARRGIAIHHSGMLPLLKETVEMLFQRGLIRLLFATDTFAMGVNMPARCVVFSSLEKFDGRKRRPLNPGEYIQMAGRAGRRGLDTSGCVIILLSDIGKSVTSSSSGMPSEQSLTSIILGKPAQLTSQFRITYSMILHLHRRNWISLQDLMRRSFMEAAALRKEISRKQNLIYLRDILRKTTSLVHSAGNSSFPTTSIESWVKNMPSTSINVPIGEPVLRVKCPLGQTSCIDIMDNYYQACFNRRQLTYSMCNFLATQNLSDLQRIFCPGRLVFLQLAASSKSNTSSSSFNQPHWLVPGILVTITKETIQNKQQLMWNVITWNISYYPKTSYTNPSYNNSIYEDQSISDIQLKSFEYSNLIDEDEEEELLLQGEDPILSSVPFPPQLMPVYVPSSHESGLSSLTLVSEPISKSLVRICEPVISFPNKPRICSLPDVLTQAITHHHQRIKAAELGMRLVSGTRTEDLSSFVEEINRFMLETIKEITLNSSSSNVSPTFYGLPPNQPVPLNLTQYLKTKKSASEDVSILDEFSLLSEELTTPLIGGGSIGSRLAPVTCPDLVSHLALVHRTCRRRWAFKRIEASLSDSTLSLNSEYLGRLRVLEELGFVDSATGHGCLTLKGLVACELQQMEVLLTQLLFDGSFTHLAAADIASLLSCFVFETKASDISSQMRKNSQSVQSDSFSHVKVADSTTSEPTNIDGVSTLMSQNHPFSVPVHLQIPLQKMLLSAEQLEQLQRKYGLDDPSSDTRLNPSMINVTYSWATGHSFSALMNLTDIPEGRLIRGLLLLDELLRHVRNACYRLGDQALSLKMNEAKNLIHRDLVCAPSLYILDELS